jgi:hypothetical protein
MSEGPSDLHVAPEPGRIQLPGGELTVSSAPEQHFPIRHSDWRQLCRKLERIKNPAPSLAAVAWTSVGIAIGAIVAYLPWTAAYSELPAKAQLHYSFISPLLVILAIATAVLAVILFIVNASIKKVNVVSIDDVLEDMNNIYAPYANRPATTTVTPPITSSKHTYRDGLSPGPDGISDR